MAKEKDDGTMGKESQLQAQIDTLKADVNKEQNARLAAEQKVEAQVTATAEAAEAQRLADEADIKQLLKPVAEEKAGANMDELTPSQMLNIIGDAVDKTSEAQNAQFAKAIETAGAKTGEELKAIREVVSQIIAKVNIDEARSKFKDFDEMSPGIRSVMDEVPGMPVNYAYILAKGLKAGKLPPAKKIETEKPDTHMTRQNVDEEEEKTSMSKAEMAAVRKEEASKAMRPSRSGRSFRQMAEDAYEKGKTTGWSHEGYSSTGKES